MSKFTIAPWVQDLVADGAEESDKSRIPIFNTEVRVAMFFILMERTETDFRNALQDGFMTPEGRRAHLWHQITYRRNKKRQWASIDTELSKAWQWAQGNIAEGKEPNPKREKDILKLAETAREAIPNLMLKPNQAKVLRYVADETARKKFLNVTCPVREAADAANLSVKGAWEAIAYLRDVGFIVCRERGIGIKGSGRAGIYRLSDLRSARAPALGLPTVADQNPSDQRDSALIRDLIEPTDPALGAGGFKLGSYHSLEPPHQDPDKASGGVR
jgi:hypothetical protein